MKIVIIHHPHVIPNLNDFLYPYSHNQWGLVFIKQKLVQVWNNRRRVNYDSRIFGRTFSLIIFFPYGNSYPFQDHKSSTKGTSHIPNDLYTCIPSFLKRHEKQTVR